MKFVGVLKGKKKPLITIVCIIGLFVLGDIYIGQKQESIIRERDAKKQRLERLAYYMIFPDIQDAWDVSGSPGNYEIVLKIENLADEPVYATHPEIRAYVQSGTFWIEIPIQDKSEEEREQIYELEKGVHLYRKIASISRDIDYSYYQMYGYMHVRFYISMFVLPQSVFKEEEVIERSTDIYMYLKPYFLSEKDILKQVTFADNKVPVMIPMPPH